MTTDLLYTEDEELLRATVRALLADRVDPAELTRSAEYDLSAVTGPLWTRMSEELGITTMHLPEDLGGAGAGPREVAVVLEELGRTIAPVPYLGSAVLATTALLATGNGPEGMAKHLGQGSTHATLVIAVTTDPAAPFADQVRVDGNGRLNGRVRAVVDAEGAGLYVVPAVDPDGLPGLYAVPSTTPGISIGTRVSLDLTRPVADVVLDDTEAGQCIASADTAVRAVQAAMTTGAGLLASEQLGIAEWCLTTTVSYLGQRRQFGRLLGSYQGLKHRLADLWVEIGGARAAARSAAALLATAGPCMEAFTGTADPDLRREIDIAVALAQYQCSTVAVRAAEEALQMHGGIGMTWELPLHLYLKRAKADQLAFGSPGRHLARLGELVDLPGPPR